MPRLSVWFVRASLIYLTIGFAFGALLLAEKGIPYFPALWSILPIHVEFLLIGWLVQLAMGVAFWILPRFGVGPPRGDERLIWASLILLNIGLCLIGFQLWLPMTLLTGRTAEVLGVLAFAVGSWRRVRPFKE